MQQIALILLGLFPSIAQAGEGLKVDVHSDIVARGEQVSPFSVDADGTLLESDPTIDAQAIVGTAIRTGPDSLKPVIRAELGVGSGALWGSPAIEGEELPGTESASFVIRKANIAIRPVDKLSLRAGLMLSQWGLGLVSNSGAERWEPGSALFTDPRGGDVNLRGMAVLAPLTDSGLAIVGFYDRVYDDDLLLDGDQAWQTGGSVSIGSSQPADPWGGLYGLYRKQTASDGGVTELSGGDLAARLPVALSDTLGLTVEAEGVVITGQTELGPSTDYPVHDILQLGGALRASLRADRAGGVLDVLYASGDQNLDDGTLNAFRADANYELGLFAYRQVLAGYSGRAVVTASDPDLVGVPSEDLDRVPTRGSATNTVALFPRFWVRPYKDLEVYGGPLLAWTEVPLVDPLNTPLAGGNPSNALGGAPGPYLGTELDLGARWPLAIAASTLTVGAEGGIFLPGSALEGGDVAPENIYGGRLLISHHFNSREE